MSPDFPASGPQASAGPAPRARLARRVLEIGLFCLPATLISTPLGLSPFVALALIALAISPGPLVHGWRQCHGALRLLWWSMLGVVVVVLVSKFHFDVRWREVDNRLRLLTLPFFALMVVAYRPDRRWLWRGALVGLVGGFAVAAFQVGSGMERAAGWTANAIVFADALIALVVLAVFCRPPGELLWTTVACGFGVAAVALSGSRGVWPGLGIVLIAALLVSGGRARRLSWAMLALAALAVAASLWVEPLARATRIQELRSDVQRLMDGDAMSSVGSRVTLYELAGQTFADYPLTGIGVGRFEQVVLNSPLCVPPAPRVEFCKLGHAHNDAAEWAATMGVPGLLALLAVYLVPLGLFALYLRRFGEGRARSTALAGLVLVLVYMLNGSSQSIFAHQLVASFYAVAIGVLYGFVLLEARPRERAG